MTEPTPDTTGARGTDRSVGGHREAVARLVGSAPVEVVALDHRARGRRLAADLVARDDLPRFDCSAMDGYAVGPDAPALVPLPVVDDVAAGDTPSVRLGPGQAARVMTGARLPEGAVAVVPVEQTDAARTGPPPAAVTPSTAPEPGRHVRRRGEDVRAGDVVASAGAAVTPALLALARSSGCVTAQVAARTRVAVVATGAELTAPGHDPGTGGIHESNSDMVAALAEAAGCVLARVTTCPDDAAALRALLDELDASGEVDLVVTTGGVSAGAHEVVRQVCEPVSTFRFVHLALQPGGPQGLGRWGATPVVCLPGTPTGAFVGWHAFVRPALDRRHGVPAEPARTAVYRGRRRHARLGRLQLLTSVLSPDGTVRTPDAGHLSALAAATCLLEVPEHVDEVVDGDVVTVHPL